MKKSWLPVAAVCAIVLAGGVYVLSGGEDAAAPGGAIVAVTMPSGLSEVAQLGQNAFNGVCADCHGENGAGREGMGPPLIHKIYEPSHHGDMSFLLAVQNGVRSHHWPFGDMPPQDGLTRSDVVNIVTFVREVQQANNIF